MKRFNSYWRVFATAIGFVAFGLGGIFLSLFILPPIYLFSKTKKKAYRRCQYIVHISFRIYTWIMSSLGILDVEFENAEKLRMQKSAIIIANHPSLIDVILILSQMPQATCIVKRALWFNPFMAAVISMAGYIPGDDPSEMVEACKNRMADGDNLIIFPEGTRSTPNQPMKLKRGAASIIVGTQKPICFVTIASGVPMLTKAQKWYSITDHRPFFRIAVHECVNTKQFIIEGEPSHKANRRINKIIENFFASRGEQDGRIDYRN